MSLFELLVLIIYPFKIVEIEVPSAWELFAKISCRAKNAKYDTKCNDKLQ